MYIYVWLYECKWCRPDQPTEAETDRQPAGANPGWRLSLGELRHAEAGAGGEPPALRLRPGLAAELARHDPGPGTLPAPAPAAGGTGQFYNTVYTSTAVPATKIISVLPMDRDKEVTPAVRLSFCIYIYI